MTSRNDITTHKENPDYLERTPSPPPTPPTPPRQPKYIFIGFFIHGGYANKTILPYRENPHASKSIMTFHSTPKLMTFTNSSPGNIVLGEADGSDNTKLANYFKTNSNINLLTDTNQNEKDQDKIIAKNFLTYSTNGLATLNTNPRDDLESFKKNKKIEEKYAPRNSFICNNKVGIGHTFINKSFSTGYPSTNEANMDSWGIFIFNNNCGIEPGINIKELVPEIRQEIQTNEDGEDIGIRFRLNDIIFYLEMNYGLTREDYLFFFDYTCSMFTEETNPRLKRDWGRQIAKDSGFGKKKGPKKHSKRMGRNKRSKKNGPNKRSKKNGRR